MFDEARLQMRLEQEEIRARQRETSRWTSHLSPENSSAGFLAAAHEASLKFDPKRQSTESAPTGGSLETKQVAAQILAPCASTDETYEEARHTASQVEIEPPARPSLDRLISLNDLIPSPKFRKTLGKMIADQIDHVAGLHNAGRYKAAKIAAAGTWALWLWYVLKSPVTSLLGAAKRVVG